MVDVRAFLLPVGEPDDPVVAGVAEAAAARSRACRRLGEDELLGATSFALRRTGRRVAVGAPRVTCPGTPRRPPAL